MTEFPESVKSERLALELTGLVSKANGRVEADVGCHDDLALATACCMYVRKYDPPLLLGDEDFTLTGAMMKDIVEYNVPGDSLEMTNASIMKNVKGNIGEKSGFIDIMTMYSSD